MLSILHGSFEPLVYGLVIFLGILSIWWKIRTGRIAAVCLEIGVFTLVFKLHGGSMAGGFAAAIAALLSGLILPWFIPSWLNQLGRVKQRSRNKASILRGE